MRLVKLHDYNGTPVFINAHSVTAIYYDSKKESTAVDYGNEETFYVTDYVEDVADKVSKAYEILERRFVNVGCTR